MAERDRWVQTFIERAEAVSAVVVRVPDLGKAVAYTVDLCVRKEACRLLMAGCAEPLSSAAERLCTASPAKTMAAPGLEPETRSGLKEICARNEIQLIDGPLRGHLAGIDIGVTMADWGIAETGTLVIDSNREAVRLATMISEIHVALLPVSRVRGTAFELEPELRKSMHATGNYLAFITGASHTADIERVLAIGVHGPLELHILLLEDR